MQRFKMRLDYDGTRYAGWQIQKGSTTTVQGELTAALGKLIAWRHEVNVVGCGRTDAGVHAKGYVAHVDLDLGDAMTINHLLHKVNKVLPQDISIVAIEPTSRDFHARFSATSRHYTYHLHTDKDVWVSRFSTRYPYKASDIKIDLLNAAASLVKGEQDFTAFCKTGSDVKHHRCTVKSAIWHRDDVNKYRFEITADRYLRGMIRLVVGMCCNVSRGKLTVPQVALAIEKGQRLPLDWSMPPQGLMLRDIRY